jgi:threonine dehydratase
VAEMNAIEAIPLAAIEAARARITEAAVRTPLVRLDVPGNAEIWLKLECLQPIGSFKIRGAANAMALARPEELAGGVYTGSAGNMAQGVAFNARRMGIECRVIVPDTAPRSKLEAIERLGGVNVPLPFDEWWAVIEEHGHPDESGFFIHPVSDPAVIAGNGTIGLEILEDLPEVDTVIAPYGGGGLSCGIASAVQAQRADVRVLASEVDTAAPFTASLQAGRPVTVERTPTFVDGIGGKSVLEEMWPLASALLDGSVVVSIPEICDAIRMLVSRSHVVAEGAGASAVAAALAQASPGERVVAVVSGGNLDVDVLRSILAGEAPGP